MFLFPMKLFAVTAFLLRVLRKVACIQALDPLISFASGSARALTTHLTASIIARKTVVDGRNPIGHVVSENS